MISLHILTAKIKTLLFNLPTTQIEIFAHNLSILEVSQYGSIQFKALQRLNLYRTVIWQNTEPGVNLLYSI